MLDRVGDLELPAPRRRDRAGGGVNLGGEHVHPHQRKVGDRRGRLLEQPHHPACLTLTAVGKLGHAVVLGIGHGREQDQRVRLVLAKGGH